MKTQERTYRGVTYDPADHERLSRASMDHAYRGHHYEAPLSQAAAKETTIELHYRGSVYQHRRAQAEAHLNF